METTEMNLKMFSINENNNVDYSYNISIHKSYKSKTKVSDY